MEDYKKLYEQTQSKMKEFIKRWDGIKLSSNDLFTKELKQIVEIESEEEQNKFAKGVLTSCALSFINYLDAHKYEGKMCVSNGECEDIEYAFHNAMWDRLHRYYCKYIEKQCEPNPYSGVSFKYNGHTWGMCARANGVEILVDGEIKERIFLDNKPRGKSALEAIKEEKVDNEPKFKVGDWVVDNCGYVWKIEGILNQFYLLEGIEGGESRPTIDWVDKTFHLWTIEDAKDGDVLVHSSFMFDDFIFIYNNTSILQAYCYYSNERNRFIIEDRGHHCPWNMQEVTPATKEQRDLLFQKMKETGYEWDAEKKELFSRPKSEWTEEDEKMLVDCFNIFHMSVYPKDKMKKAINWLKSLRPQKQ